MEHAGSEPGPRPTLERGGVVPGAAPRAAPGAGRSPSTHPRLERFRGGKAQPRRAFLSRSRATRLRSRLGCSRYRRCPLVGFAKGGEGQEVAATTAREGGGASRRTDVGRAGAHGARLFSPPPAEFREARRAGVTRTLAHTKRDAQRGVRVHVRPADTSHRRTYRAWKLRSEAERSIRPSSGQVSHWFL